MGLRDKFSERLAKANAEAASSWRAGKEERHEKAGGDWQQTKERWNEDTAKTGEDWRQAKEQWSEDRVKIGEDWR